MRAESWKLMLVFQAISLGSPTGPFIVNHGSNDEQECNDPDANTKVTINYVDPMLPKH